MYNENNRSTLAALLLFFFLNVFQALCNFLTHSGRSLDCSQQLHQSQLQSPWREAVLYISKLHHFLLFRKHILCIYIFKKNKNKKNMHNKCGDRRSAKYKNVRRIVNSAHSQHFPRSLPPPASAYCCRSALLMCSGAAPQWFTSRCRLLRSSHISTRTAYGLIKAHAHHSWPLRFLRCNATLVAAHTK